MNQRTPWYMRAITGSAVLIVALALIATYADLWAAPSEQRFLITLLTNVILVLGVQVYVGNSGIVSFGHIGFMAIGAYAAALTSIPAAVKSTALPNLPGILAEAQVGFVPSVLIGAVAAGVFAAAVGLVIIRLSGGAGAIASLAVLVVVYVVASNWTDVTGGVRAIYGIPALESVWYVFAVAAVAVVAARLFREAGPGLQLRASADDPLAAEAAGVNTLRLRYAAWILSALIVGAGGALFAWEIRSFGPSAFYLRETFFVLAMLIIGGMGSVTGAVTGAVLVSIANEWLRGLENGFSFAFLEVGQQIGIAAIIVAAVMLLLLSIRPQGIVGAREADELFGGGGAFARWRRKIVRRYALGENK